MTGEGWAKARRLFGDGSGTEVRISFLGGGFRPLAAAFGDGEVDDADELLLCHPGAFPGFGLSSLLRKHRESGAEATLVVARSYPLPVGVAYVARTGTVEEVREKPDIDVSVATGYMVIGRRAARVAARSEGAGDDLAADLVPGLVRETPVAAFYAGEGWRDLSSPSGMESLDLELSGRRYRTLTEEAARWAHGAAPSSPPST